MNEHSITSLWWRNQPMLKCIKHCFIKNGNSSTIGKKNEWVVCVSKLYRAWPIIFPIGHCRISINERSFIHWLCKWTKWYTNVYVCRVPMIRRGGRQGFQGLATSMLGTFELCMDAWKSNGHMAHHSCIRYIQHAARWKNGRWSNLHSTGIMGWFGLHEITWDHLLI